MKIGVLGAGMVGRTIALDLSKSFQVTSFDMNADNLATLQEKNPSINCIKTNLLEYTAYKDLFHHFDIMVSAVPGFMGFKTLQTLIECGKDIADISFFPEDALVLDDLAQQNKVTAIVDCGVAPGMSNLVLGYYNQKMKIKSFECMVGGLPKTRTFPYEYKAPFSPVDVIEEYMRPARFMENSNIVTKEALSDCELINVKEVGTLEAFNTDGLRSILHTMKHIPDMKEKTLRYPGHVRLIQALKHSGFFNEEPLIINGIEIKPVDFTSKILFDQWKLLPGDPEFTVMQIQISGEQSGEQKMISINLYDENDNTEGLSSMSRTTGFTCAAAVHMLANKKFTKNGVFPPELIGGTHGIYELFMKYLEERNVRYVTTTSPL